MAKWSDLPNEVKELIVDWAAEDDDPVLDEVTGRKLRYTTLRALRLLDRTTSERAASHLWREVSFQWTSPLQRIISFANDVAPTVGHHFRMLALADVGNSTPSGPSSESATAIAAYASLLNHASKLEWLQLVGLGAFVQKLGSLIPSSLKDHLTRFDTYYPLDPEVVFFTPISAGEAAIIVESLPALKELNLFGVAAKGTDRLVKVLQEKKGLEKLGLSGWKKMDYGKLVGDWASSLNSLYFDSPIPLAALRDLVSCHKLTLNTLNLGSGFEQTSPAIVFDLPSLTSLSLCLDGTDATNAFFDAFPSSNLLHLSLELQVEPDKMVELIDRMEEEVKKLRPSLRSLELRLSEEGFTTETGETLNHLMEVCGDLDVSIYSTSG